MSRLTVEKIQEEFKNVLSKGIAMPQGVMVNMIDILLIALDTKDKYLEEASENTFTRITELIGEMGWGVGLPVAMEVVVQEIGGDPEKVAVVDSRNYEKIFDAIYRKLKENPSYQPLVIERDKLATAYNNIDRLTSELAAYREALERIAATEHKRYWPNPECRACPACIAEQALNSHKEE